MRWKRRRSIWPPLVALIVLLLLTLTAPHAWQRYRSRMRLANLQPTSQPTHRSAATPPPANQTPTHAQTAHQPRFAPPLPPVVRPGAKHLAPDQTQIAPVTAPILGNADDYDDYDYQDYSVIAQPPVTPTAERSELNLRPVLVEAPRQFEQASLAALISMREAIDSFLSGTKANWQAAQQAHAQSLKQERNNAAGVARSAPRVRVHSSDDRLAMVTPRPISQPTSTEHSILILPPPKNQTLAEATLRWQQPDALRIALNPRQSRPTTEDSETRSSPVMPQEVQPSERAPQQKVLGAALPSQPRCLLEQLVQLSRHPQAHQWAEETLRRVETLATHDADGSTPQHLRELIELSDQGLARSHQIADPALRTEWLRTSSSLARRLPVWQALLNPVAVANAASKRPAQYDREGLLAALREIAQLTAGSESGEAWSNFLLLDEIAQLAQETDASNDATANPDLQEARRRLTRRLLARTNDARLSDAQRKFLQTSAMQTVQDTMRQWSTGPVSLAALADLIERYETKPSMRYAQGIAKCQQRLEWSSYKQLRDLATHLDQTYRNANLRMAVTGELLNRLIPETKPVVSPVRDQVAGAQIRGRAKTTTKVNLRLLPDPEAWRLSLEANGNVRSNTYSDTWPAKVHNAGKLRFEASKEIVVTRRGLQTAPAEASTRGRNDLVGVDSQFSPVPLLGPLVENVARNKHRQMRGPALAKVKRRVNREAKSRMNTTTEKRLNEIEQVFQTRILSPLESLALSAEPVDLYTTEKRAVMRLRMADAQHLAASTPRPSAPSDSLASAQLHESALNNAASGLGLDGQQLTAGILHTMLSAKLTGQATPAPKDLPVRARVEFADYDAVRLRCDNDRLELILNIKQLSRGRDRIRNFQVHAFFRPQLDGLQVNLVREGSLQFAGPRLKTGPRMVLHSVFGKLLHKAQELPLLADQLETDKRFQGLMVTQLVIEDGWIAVALGPDYPQRTAWRTRNAPKTLVR